MAANPNKLSSPFTLYYGVYSMYSTMVRTTFALRGPVRPDGRPEMKLQPHAIDISPSSAQQLSNTFLGTINPNGLVPVLANDTLLSKPILESTNISWYLAEWYPQLLPAECENEIRALVGELHRINAGVLTMGPGGKVFRLLLEKTRALLEQDDISEEYRGLLKVKEKQLEGRLGRMTNETLDEAIHLTKTFLPKVQSLLAERRGVQLANGAYTLGPTPTVLDAHVLVFLCRLCDVRRSELVPALLLEWVEHFRKGAEWKEVMKVVPGGTTLPAFL